MKKIGLVGLALVLPALASEPSAADVKRAQSAATTTPGTSAPQEAKTPAQRPATLADPHKTGSGAKSTTEGTDAGEAARPKPYRADPNSRGQ